MSPRFRSQRIFLFIAVICLAFVPLQAAEYMMAPVQQEILGAATDYRSHQVIDFDQDGYDDLAVLWEQLGVGRDDTLQIVGL